MSKKIMNQEEKLFEETMEYYKDGEIETMKLQDEKVGSMDSLKLYLDEIGRIPLLTAEEELELAKTIAIGGPSAKEAKDKLVTSNLKLAFYYAKQYMDRGVDLEDLNSMAIEGLLKAADKYDYTLGNRFSTCAYWWIRQAISRGIIEKTKSIRTPEHMVRAINKVNKAKRKLSQELSRNPSIEEIALATGYDKEKVKATFEAMYTTVSLDAPVGAEEDCTLADFVPDKRTLEPYGSAISKELCDNLEIVLSQLAPREARILKLRYGIDTDHAMTLEEISELPDINVSRERVRQIEISAIKKIRRNTKMMELLQDYAMAG